MRNNLKKIKGLLTKFKGFEVSPDLDRTILKAISNAHVEREFKLVGPSFFTYLSNLIRHNLKRYAVTIIIAVMAFGGVMFFNQNSYIYHLTLAKNALSELEQTLQGNPDYQSFIPGAYAEESVTQKTIDEAKVTGLSKKVVDETDAAIDAAEHLSNPSELKKALNEINDVQLQSIDVLSDAVEAVSSDEATKTVSDVLNTTTTQQELINKAIKFAGKAIENKEKDVNIDVETSSDVAFKKGKGNADDMKEGVTVFKQDINEIQSQFDDARKEVLNLESKGAPDDELVKLENKLIKAKIAITDGKLQRAHGLTTAVKAKSRNIVRKAEKMTEKALEKDDETDEFTNDSVSESSDKRGQSDEKKKESNDASDNSSLDDEEGKNKDGNVENSGSDDRNRSRSDKQTEDKREVK